ncbi:hypothetical protein HanIR_Chr09g0394281 [Helianthus annuus]|nr:hypothetical protein HanIR_Chr09g0394281 [Helianthus annuus]
MEGKSMVANLKSTTTWYGVAAAVGYAIGCVQIEVHKSTAMVLAAAIGFPAIFGFIKKRGFG